LMRIEHDGIILWYGTSDAPAPPALVAAGAPVVITVAVAPIDASNRVSILYRVNGGEVETVAARWRRTDMGMAQHFVATLGPFRSGDTVDYAPVCESAGRQVPSAEELWQTASSSFAVQPEAVVANRLTMRGMAGEVMPSSAVHE